MKQLFQINLASLAFIGLIFMGMGVVFINSQRDFKRSNNYDQKKSSELSVIASFYPYEFLTETIGGEKVEVVGVVPPGIEPHDFELSTQNLVDIQNSKLLILNGVLEPWANDVAQTLSSSQTKILNPGYSIMKGENDQLDPHIWLSPVAMQKMAADIAKMMQEIDPDNSSYYQQNVDKLIEELKKLDEDYRKGLNSCKRRDIITTHEAFGYLANEYNLNQIGITGLSPDSEPSFQKLRELTLFSQENDIKYIFFEEKVSPEFAQTIAHELRADTLVLNPIETLSEDELQLGEDYLSEMYKNLTQLRLALECQ